MAYNSLSVTRQTPYVINNYRGAVKPKEEDEKSSQSAHESHLEQEQQQQNINKEVNNDENKNVYQRLAESKASQQKAIASRDANLKNATVNIAQVLKDFKNTIKAIGTPPELADEVNEYLNLVTKQVTKDNPDIKLVRSNLKNAASVLDGYISETLQKTSNVVENWINALFLQQINYKFNEEEINPNFLVNFPNEVKENKNENLSKNKEEEITEENKTEKIIIIPQDEKLKNLFIQAKKYSYAKDYQKAMRLFKEALNRSIEVQDKETESKILFEIGSIYDKNDYLAQALTSYNRSLNVAGDLNIKTKAHYSMAQIYDDVAQFECAINHYMTSISYAGETENFSAQTTSLTKIGNIYADKYDKEAFEFFTEAEKISKESNNCKTKGYVCANIADAYDKFNEPQNALKYFSNAIKEYEEAQSPLKVAVNYKKAAELMKDYNNNTKAKKLMQKALTKARQTDDIQLMTEIHQALSAI